MVWGTRLWVWCMLLRRRCWWGHVISIVSCKFTCTLLLFQFNNKMFRYWGHLWSSFIHSKIISQALCQSWCWRSWTSSSIGRSPEPRRPTTTYHRLIAGETIGTAVKRQMVSWGNTVWCFPIGENAIREMESWGEYLIALHFCQSLRCQGCKFLFDLPITRSQVVHLEDYCSPSTSLCAIFLCSLDVEICAII